MSAPTWQVEPLGPWGRPVTEPRASSGRFSTTWPKTLDKLLTEIDYLEPTGVIAVRVDVENGQIRRDGMLHARARVEFPGVVVSFTSATRGPLTFATDAYEQQWSGALPGWQANIRAIALSLEALRAVDRYGVSSGREQYVGWRAIEAGPAADAPFRDATGAERWLRRRMGDGDHRRLSEVIREARSRMHPDRGNGRGDWDLLERAVELLHAGGLLR